MAQEGTGLTIQDLADQPKEEGPASPPPLVSAHHHEDDCPGSASVLLFFLILCWFCVSSVSVERSATTNAE